MKASRSNRASQDPPWVRIHLIPDTPYVIDKRVWPQGPPEYRFTSVGLVPCDPIPARLGIEIERLLSIIDSFAKGDTQ